MIDLIDLTFSTTVLDQIPDYIFVISTDESLDDDKMVSSRIWIPDFPPKYCFTL